MISDFRIYKSEDKLPREGEIVLGYFPSRPWMHPEDRQGVFLRTVYRKKYKNIAGNKYRWEEFGPNVYGAEEMEFWIEIPCLKSLRNRLDEKYSQKPKAHEPKIIYEIHDIAALVATRSLGDQFRCDAGKIRYIPDSNICVFTLVPYSKIKKEMNLTTNMVKKLFEGEK